MTRPWSVSSELERLPGSLEGKAADRACVIYDRHPWEWLEGKDRRIMSRRSEHMDDALRA